jgi:putative heme iron utilization protein
VSSSLGKHGASGSGSGQPAAPEPSFAERARTLTHMQRIGSLSTLSRKQPGFPFGSVMPYSVDGQGRPIFLISSMAMHTQNLKADSRASLLVTQPGADGDPLGASRVTLIGSIIPVPEPDLAQSRELYLARYANSRYWVDYEDFSFYRMEVVDLYYVGGFGVMGWIAAAEYGAAQPDPLADSSQGIIEHMNADHADALALLARSVAGIDATKAVMTAVDRLGFHLRLNTTEGMRGARIAFPREARSPEEVRSVLVAMVEQARRH